MNKWITKGMVGLAISTTAISMSVNASEKIDEVSSVNLSIYEQLTGATNEISGIEGVLVDPVDIVFGKLKERPRPHLHRK